MNSPLLQLVTVAVTVRNRANTRKYDDIIMAIPELPSIIFYFHSLSIFKVSVLQTEAGQGIHWEGVRQRFWERL